MFYLALGVFGYRIGGLGLDASEKMRGTWTLLYRLTRSGQASSDPAFLPNAIIFKRFLRQGMVSNMLISHLCSQETQVACPHAMSRVQCYPGMVISGVVGSLIYVVGVADRFSDQ